jgi:acyl-coenzyme A thioesterase PaaI-like protein
MIDPHRFTNAMPRNVPSPVVTDSSPTAARPNEAELRIRAGKAVRDLGHALVGHQADDDTLALVAEHLEALTARLATGDTRQRPAHNFQRGADWSPPGEGDEVIATVTLRAAHEGAPARSHGGIVAALFDDVFGFVLAIHQTPGFTGELGIRYEAGTPLHVPLTCRVRLAERQGRKLFMTGELSADDGAVCVRATATFIAIDPARLAWGEGV